jgi:lysophospholipase L1-like esterase
VYEKITAKYAPYGKKNIEIFLGSVETKKALREIPHPYMLWVNTPDFVNQEGIKETNNLGYRNKNDFDIVNDSDNLKILALGGSTTWGYLLGKPEEAWPGQLEKILNSKLKRNSSHTHIQVINGGLNYATSAELLLHYLFRDRYLKPDIVIIHTGGNDVHPLIFDGYKPDYSDFRPGWNSPVHNLRKGEIFFIKHSNIIKLFYAFWLRDSLSLPYITKQPKSFNHHEESYYIQNAIKNSPVGFQRNLELLLRNIIADGSIPILFPFVMSDDNTYENLRPDSANRAKYTKKMRKASVIALKKNIEVMVSLSEKYHVLLFDLPANNIPTKYFLDHCHLSKEGENIKATFLAKKIQTLLKETKHLD